MRRLLFALVLVTLACGSGSKEPRRLNLYPSPTANPTQTPFVLEVTTTPVSTYTPIVKVVTETPLGSLCVSAAETVHLRPSASTDGYPITVLENKTVVEDLGGRDGKWWFVKYGELSGWVHSSYVIACNSTKE